MNAIILSAILGVVMMFSSVFVKNAKAYKSIALVGILLLLFANINETNNGSFFDIDTYGMMDFNAFGLFFNTIIIVCTGVYFLLTSQQIEKVGNYTAEYFTLIFFVLCGAFILSSFENLLLLFIGIEILSIPLYILTGTKKKDLKSNEAALKYFLMGAFSTGLMLMGIALIYGGTGTFGLENVLPSANGEIDGRVMSFLNVAGMLLLTFSLAFKVSAAPFHFWTPDVYDGAPSVFTSFMATIVKASAFVAFLKLFLARAATTSVDINRMIGVDWKMIVAILIICTLLIGNVTALLQKSVKRMLAYSSIAQAGFMLFAIFSLNETAKEGMLLYAVAYSLATIGIFAILSRMKDYSFDGYNGLAKKYPALAFTNTVFLLSLTGIPLTAGFFAKYYMLASVMQTGNSMWLVIVGVLFAATSAAYYFRVIQSMYFKESATESEYFEDMPSKGFSWMLVLLSIVIIVVGLFPQVVLNCFYN
ncbi:MAG: NADH-quinone oxidoreductase subunit F [Pseudopedobacter saltans]|uniref:NADH-quinone oxidoreductase subunit N n=1 Tax=Pseudopedobacter saltans TaxID=151895 RepID=A0A2W5G7H3_9SPHI|nr:MAG: NADH-quinone oxidoreductase subunit F [Pseudopedobacter saltans]